MKILLAIDGSGQSEAVTDQVACHRFPSGSEVRIISVVERPYYTATYDGGALSVSLYEELEQESRERAHAAVTKSEATLRAEEENHELKIKTEVLAGSPKRVILEQAEAFGADLIVVGSHGQGNLERFLLGSVSQAVALHAKCSVEIVRSPNAQSPTSQ